MRWVRADEFEVEVNIRVCVEGEGEVWDGGCRCNGEGECGIR